MRNRESVKPGMRVKIVEWAVGTDNPWVREDREQLIGATGTVIEVGLYISVKLDEDKAKLPSAVLCVPGEIELITDADTDQAQTA